MICHIFSHSAQLLHNHWNSNSREPNTVASILRHYKITATIVAIFAPPFAVAVIIAVPVAIAITNPVALTGSTLFIDLIDAKMKEMIRQGEGIGTLTKNTDKKDEEVAEFVGKMLAQYPAVKK
ncbi:MULTISPECIES: DUF4136 domain-containing protein [unclassified Flavobacterium]|uniref:DUF4136 domain-containing protein n=1 Tax=unclassified Flavobacterium TaxID=196869 RepID=UPI001E531FD2|nr:MULTISPECIES: DUF4136 domain-containing protein [unclassified Flavobacterium]